MGVTITKPPLGIKPKCIWESLRMHELQDAIVRYIRADFPIPNEWVEEYNELISKHGEGEKNKLTETHK